MRRFLNVKVLIAGAVLVFLLVESGFLLRSVSRDLRGLATASQDNVHWNLTQLEVELLRLGEAADDAQSGAPNSLREVRKRFDIFYSRVRLMQTSSQLKMLWADPSNNEHLEKLDQFLQDAAPLIDGPADELRAKLPQLIAATREQYAPARALALQGVMVFAEASDQSRLSISDTLVKLVTSTLILILGMVLGLFLLVRLLRTMQTSANHATTAQSRLEAMVSSSLDAILVIDTKGTLLEFNGAAETVFGLTREDALGQEMAALIVPEKYRQAHRDGMDRFLATAEKRVIDAGRLRLEAMRSNGEVFPAEVSISMAHSQGGAVFVAFLRDITQQVEAEEKLRLALDQAQAGEKAKSELLTVMSHEMRTPLNGILGSLELIQRDPLTERQQRNLAAAKVSGDLLLSHVSDVLDLSRLDAEKVHSRQEQFSLRAMIDRIFQGQSAAARTRDNTLEVTFLTEDLDWVLGDAAALNRCLVNLVGNAIKFTRDGSVALELERVGQSRQVVIRVVDTGIGIPEERLETVFDEFVTLDTSYGREAAGTGLGLAITQRLVLQMGGEIEVESIEGEGSLFQISVPLPAAQVDTLELEAIPDLYDAVVLAEQRILVVEDNPINRDIIADMLGDLGHVVATAEGGALGVELASQRQFDLILMDVSMPGIDGLEALRQIRADAGASSLTPALAVTAHAASDDHHRLTHAGFRGILTKPVSMGQLRRGIAMALDPNLQPGWVVNTASTSGGLEVRRDLVQRIGADKSNALDQKLLLQCRELHKDLSGSQEVSEAQQLSAHNLAGIAALLGHLELQRQLKQIEDCNARDWPERREAALRTLAQLARALEASLTY